MTQETKTEIQRGRVFQEEFLHVLDLDIENQIWTTQNLSIPKLFRRLSQEFWEGLLHLQNVSCTGYRNAPEYQPSECFPPVPVYSGQHSSTGPFHGRCWMSSCWMSACAFSAQMSLQRVTYLVPNFWVYRIVPIIPDLWSDMRRSKVEKDTFIEGSCASDVGG